MLLLDISNSNIFKKGEQNMKFLILGILVIKEFTVYEIRNIIHENFQSMCSNSMGSIQIAIKKLLAENLIVFNEIREKNVTKKLYSITDTGRDEFIKWLKTPIDMSKTKNMEIGKLLFMGMVPVKNRLSLISEIIESQKEELRLLENIKKLRSNEEFNNIIEFHNNNEDYKQGLLKISEQSDIENLGHDINNYELLTLQYGIDNTKFNIKWFENVKKEIKKGNL